jgi:hypothetical protein
MQSTTDYQGKSGQLYGEHTKSGKHYVYQHVNVETSEVFYVGLGKFNRCNQVKQRNRFWKHYTNKHKYFVKLVATNLSREEAAKTEVKMILALKPRCNLTSGGEQGTLLGLRVYAFTKEGTLFKCFETISEANNFFEVQPNDSRISRCLSGERQRFKGFLWSKKLSPPPTYQKRKYKAKTVHQYDLLGNWVASFSSPREANVPTRTGVYAVLDSSKTYAGSFWRSKKTNKIVVRLLKPALVASKKVLCTQTMKVYASLSEACKDKKLKHQTLSKKLRGLLKNNTELVFYGD